MIRSTTIITIQTACHPSCQRARPALYVGGRAGYSVRRLVGHGVVGKSRRRPPGLVSVLKQRVISPNSRNHSWRSDPEVLDVRPSAMVRPKRVGSVRRRFNNITCHHIVRRSVMRKRRRQRRNKHRGRCYRRPRPYYNAAQRPQGSELLASRRRSSFVEVCVVVAVAV